MVTSRNQSEDEEGGGGGGGGVSIPRTTQSHEHQLSCTQAISFSVQHFCSTRFNHPAAILFPNAVYQGKEKEKRPQTGEKPPATLTVSQLQMHLAAYSQKREENAKGVTT